uniref:Secreted protein n=1 Tax=Heterorhabditis bacteriophora TaxID=37862 RepID=A0A1I7WBG7_HETBA
MCAACACVSCRPRSAARSAIASDPQHAHLRHTRDEYSLRTYIGCFILISYEVLNTFCKRKYLQKNLYFNYAGLDEYYLLLISCHIYEIFVILFYK